LPKSKSIICPRCGERGFLSRRWVRKSFYPQHRSIEINVYEFFLKKLQEDPSDSHAQHMVSIRKPYIRGKKYRGKPKYLIKKYDSDKDNDFDKEECYRVHTRKYYYFYVGHYDKVLYQKQKKDYELKKRKSKPYGRKWCKLPIEDEIYYNTKEIVSEKRLEYLKNFLIKKYA